MFSFFKVDGKTGAGLPGAIFSLKSFGGAAVTAVSGGQGLTRFSVEPCLCYMLTEIQPPSGYAPSSASFQISLDLCGRVFVNGRLTERFALPDERLAATGSFTAVKVNILTGSPLAGAEFTLSMNSQVIATATSTITGAVTFTGLSPGTYQLEETITPNGYQPSEPLTVIVAEDGLTTINGLPADGYQLANVPIFRFAFFKISSETMTELAGAIFRLSSDGAVVGTAISDAVGLADFGEIAPGTYQLTEIEPPTGYLPNTGVYAVEVAADGVIVVNGIPLESFVVINMPSRYPYTVNYYAGGITEVNLVGTVMGAGALGDSIDVDLTLFAPAGYATPGTRSGATYITNIPENNVVNVVYARQLIRWYIEYYVDNITPSNLVGRVLMPGIAYGTVVTLTPAQLDAFRPDFFQAGVQVGGPVAVTIDGQVIQVLYLPVETRTITINHFIETAYGSGAYTLYMSTQMSAYDGDVIIGSSLVMNIGPSYVFSFANPSQLTVSSGSNTITLYYRRIAS